RCTVVHLSTKRLREPWNGRPRGGREGIEIDVETADIDVAAPYRRRGRCSRCADRDPPSDIELAHIRSGDRVLEGIEAGMPGVPAVKLGPVRAHGERLLGAGIGATLHGGDPVAVR